MTSSLNGNPVVIQGLKSSCRETPQPIEIDCSKSCLRIELSFRNQFDGSATKAEYEHRFPEAQQSIDEVFGEQSTRGPSDAENVSTITRDPNKASDTGIATSNGAHGGGRVRRL